MSSEEQKHRSRLPMPNTERRGLITYDAKDPETKFPPIPQLRPPKGAPNVLIVLIDDAGFGSSSAFGGPCQTPNAEKLAAGGLQYNRFHTTALCSATRQALLTGRNHHSAGMGCITEIASGAPGYNSVLPNSMSPLAQTLKLNGYNTAQFGKCHEVPVWETSPVGPFDAWPTGGGGFEYFYGFIGGEANQWYPTLYEGTTPVDLKKTPEEGYNLVEDMTDKACAWISPAEGPGTRKALLRLLRARRHPRPAPRAEGMGRQVQGQVRRGWDKLREETFARQKKLGVIPPDCQLTARHKEIPAWDEMPEALKPVLRRQMEVYAGFMEYTDHHVGRIFDGTEETGHPRRHAHLLHHRRQRRFGRGHVERHLQRNAQLQRHGRHRDAGVSHGADRQVGRARFLPPLCRGLGACHGHALPVDQAGCFALGRHAQWHHRPLAEGDQDEGRDALAVPPCHRRCTDDPRSGGPPRAGIGERRAAVAPGGREHAVLVQRRQGGRAARDAVLRDVRQPRHLPQGLDRGDAAQDAVGAPGRSRRLRRRRVGALRHGEGLEPGQRPLQADAGETPRTAAPVAHRGDPLQRAAVERRPDANASTPTLQAGRC